MFYKFSDKLTSSDNYSPNKKGLLVGYVTYDELKDLAPQLGFDPSTVASCQSTNTVFRSGIEIYDNYTFTELKVIDPVHGKNDDSTDYLALYFKHDVLIVVDVEDTDSSTKNKFERALKRFTPSSMTLEKLIYAFFDELLAKDVGFIEKLGLEVSDMEESIIEGTPDDDINSKLLKLKRKLLQVHNYYEQCLDIFETLDANENDIFDMDTLMYISNITQRVVRLREDVDSINNAVVHLQDAYSAYLDKKMNTTMKYLTVLTTVFFPLTIIVGWYGMNFLYMPEFAWKYGYLYVIGLSIATIVLLAFIARKKNWF
ncbi:MAG: hypothetical protein MJ094_02580 [Saccharofermentans sp.]|nr:hypothetical protein [Saccharofermentans sp.]